MRKDREAVPEIERARPIIEGRFVVSVINVIVKSLLDRLLRSGILRMPETRVGEPTSLYLEYTFVVRLCPLYKTGGLKIALTGGRGTSGCQRYLKGAAALRNADCARPRKRQDGKAARAPVEFD